jgi:hypothetical protein
MVWVSNLHGERRRPTDGAECASNEVVNDAVRDGIIEEDHERVNSALCFDRRQEDRELVAETKAWGFQ